MLAETTIGIMFLISLIGSAFGIIFTTSEDKESHKESAKKCIFTTIMTPVMGSILFLLLYFHINRQQPMSIEEFITFLTGGSMSTGIIVATLLMCGLFAFILLAALIRAMYMTYTGKNGKEVVFAITIGLIVGIVTGIL